MLFKAIEKAAELSTKVSDKAKERAPAIKARGRKLLDETPKKALKLKQKVESELYFAKVDCKYAIRRGVDNARSK